MISFRKIAAAAGSGKTLAAYLRETTTVQDANRKLASYYGGWDAAGTWRRDMSQEVASALGIDRRKPPTDEALERLFEARRADTGARWTKQKREISAVDLTASPHKSVTLAYVGAKSEAERAALLQAVWRANDYAMHAFASRLGRSRKGRGGRNGVVPGDVAWCSFMHFTARPTHEVQDGKDGPTTIRNATVGSDPQIHIHNPWWNLTVCEDGSLGSIELGQLRHVKEFGGIFQARLGDELRALGVRVRYDKDESATVIDVIPDHISDLFSKGRAATLRKAKAHAEAQGLDWDDLPKHRKHKLLNAAAVANRLHKQDGEGDMERWLAEGRAAGWEHETCFTHEPPLALTREQRLDAAYAFTARHLAEEFRTRAVLDIEVLRRWAARSLIGVGIDSPRDVDDVVKVVTDRGLMIDGKRSDIILGRIENRVRLTHTAQVELEREVAALAASMAQDRRRSLPPERIERAIARSGVTFENDEQRDAAVAFLQGPALVFLEGVHGAGKTKAVLPPCVEAWKEDGRRIIGLCQAWRQTDDLSDAGITERVALSPFLDGIRDGRIEVDGNTVLVVDEMAQLSPRQFVQLQRLWLEHGTTIRSMGDREQCQSIEAASAAEIIARELPEAALPRIMETIRQRTPEQREIATLFREGKAEEALKRKRALGAAQLVGGDYDQVVARIADRFIVRRDEGVAKGWTKGVAISALTNQDAAEISKAVRERLKARGEIAAGEVVYQAVDNRGRRYDLPVAIGDRHRLFRRTSAAINGHYEPIGNNGDVVEIVGWWADGLRLKAQDGRVGDVRWQNLKDPETGRLMLGYGYCLTIDAAQGLTSSWLIDALPRGTAGITAYKAYVAESRHVEGCETLISEGALRQDVYLARPLGDPRPITEEDLWKRAANDMSAKPQKALGIDLLRHVLDNQEALIDDMMRIDARLDDMQRAGRNLPEEIFGRVEDIRLRAAIEPVLSGFEAAVAARGDGDRRLPGQSCRHAPRAARAVRRGLRDQSSRRDRSQGPGCGFRCEPKARAVPHSCRSAGGWLIGTPNRSARRPGDLGLRNSLDANGANRVAGVAGSELDTSTSGCPLAQQGLGRA